MSDHATMTWTDANQQYLAASLAAVERALAEHAGQPVDADAPATTGQRLAEMAAAMPAPPALEALCQLFGLSPFERDILLLCAGVELEAAFAPLCAAAQGDPRRDHPTFSLALAALPGAHWSALSPEAPLRHWELVHLEPGRALTRSPLRIDERILHTLVGIPHLDERLEGLVRPLTAAEPLVPSHQALAPCQEALGREIAAAWAHAAGQGPLPAVQLCGPREASRQAVAAHVCALLGLDPYLMPAAALPPQPGEAARLRRAWEREAILGERALLLECDDLDRQDAARESALAHWLAGGFSPLFLSSRQRRAPHGRALLTYDVPKPSTAEQRGLWEAALGGEAARLDGHLERLVAQFELEGPAMRAAWAKAQGRLAAGGNDGPPAAEALGRALWEVCRVQARPQLDDLAQRIEPVATWDDLVLPEAQRQTLRDIAIHVRQRTQVYERWDFLSKGQRGLGISALFAGASGTGKTMAAEVLAGELRLDLYRIDLSAVVSKYIGETEKNLRQVFDAAEGGGAILLFDEADALFGKRSEVKDSHDRYANIEVSYLLQRMEAYRGLAILTTNRKDALDDAFTRRIRFIVQFPFPGPVEREAIWRGIYPAATPTEGLEAARLAQLNLAGGDIRNVALKAAFLAADAGEPVRMGHLLRAARHEYAKLERTLTGAEIRGWDGGER